MKIDNLVLTKSYAFAVRIVRLYQHLSAQKKEFVLSQACPVKSRIVSTGYRVRVFHQGSHVPKRPVKWVFSRKGRRFGRGQSPGSAVPAD